MSEDGAPSSSYFLLSPRGERGSRKSNTKSSWQHHYSSQKNATNNTALQLLHLAQCLFCLVAVSISGHHTTRRTVAIKKSFAFASVCFISRPIIPPSTFPIHHDHSCSMLHVREGDWQQMGDILVSTAGRFLRGVRSDLDSWKSCGDMFTF
jgi:hypothetical protein